MSATKSVPRRTLNATIVKPGAKSLQKREKFDPKCDLAPERIKELLKRLAAAYPNAECALHHRNAWELLAATILSAQCTDARVNLVTPELFRRFPTPEAMSRANLPELEEMIRSTGFYRNKAKSLQGAGKVITEEYGGKVPETM